MKKGRTPRAPRKVRKTGSGGTVAVPPKKPLTAKEKRLEHRKHHLAGIKAAKTRKEHIKQYEKTHHGQKPPVHHASAPVTLDIKVEVSPNVEVFTDMVLQFILGDNDVRNTCTSVAIANSLFIHTGHKVTYEELQEFGDITEDLTILDSLEMAKRVGVGGIKPSDYEPVSPARICPGVIVGLDLSRGRHAVVLGENGIVTWGREIAMTNYFFDRITEAWLVEWPQVTKERA